MKIRYIGAAALLVATAATVAVPAAGKKARKGQKPRVEAAAKTETDSLLDFLYSAMPLPDKAMYSRDFFRQNVESSLRARREMPWGAKVPDREFRHFVLPVRVNNENLDMSRPVFYEELKERVKGLGMADAILEINHWCHEKVTYQPSDARTSSPLSSVSQAIGRCGEESTFTVAALRAMGIPARQVYTPRWAHTDDNHAWVEAWADGKWYFLGACEPEPILNLAWFNSPASRGMLMHTNVFGVYDGPEEVCRRTPYFTTINVTENYAPVSEIKARVLNADGTPAAAADVRFCLYNYGEYYPILVTTADASGESHAQLGRGDVVIWASKDGKFGFARANASAPAVITLDKDGSYTGTAEFDLTPPPASASLPKPTAEQAARNEARKSHEDSIRRAYVATFADSLSSAALGRELGIDPARTAFVLTQARGNHKALAGFLRSLPAASRARALDMLCAMSEKDRRDVAVGVLEDHLKTPDGSGDLYVEYVLNPRIEIEGLTPYKEYFASLFPEKQQKAFRAAPSKWADEVRRHVTINNDENPGRYRMSPRATWEQKRGDDKAAAICFVAGARSFGIPARIDPVTGKTQYADAAGRWTDVKLADEQAAPKAAPTGKLRASKIEAPTVRDPKYYSHFTLSKMENGRPQLQEYPENMTLKEFIGEPRDLEEGQYMLVTGQRLADGGVLARSEFFSIKEGETTDLPFIFRSDDTAVQVIGSLNAENIYHDLATDENRSLLSTTGRGYYVLGIIRPNHEPSEHALNDISALAADFDKWGGKVMLLFADEDAAKRFDASRFPKLPKTVVYGIDNDGASMRELTESLNLTEGESPVFVIADTFNRVVYKSQGYTIGMGEKLMDVIHKLK